MGDPSSNRYGAVAFGAATLPGQVPVTGSSTYSEIVNGSSDVINSNSFDGSYRVPVSGTVDLGFDFAKGTLDGSISLNLNDYSPATIGTFAFKDTVFSVGSTAYSGKFATAASGQNYFLGQFTGPNARRGDWRVGAALHFRHGKQHPDGRSRGSPGIRSMDRQEGSVTAASEKKRQLLRPFLFRFRAGLRRYP